MNTGSKAAPRKNGMHASKAKAWRLHKGPTSIWEYTKHLGKVNHSQQERRMQEQGQEGFRGKGRKRCQKEGSREEKEKLHPNNYCRTGQERSRGGWKQRTVRNSLGSVGRIVLCSECYVIGERREGTSQGVLRGQRQPVRSLLEGSREQGCGGPGEKGTRDQ